MPNEFCEPDVTVVEESQWGGDTVVVTLKHGPSGLSVTDTGKSVGATRNRAMRRLKDLWAEKVEGEKPRVKIPDSALKLMRRAGDMLSVECMHLREDSDYAPTVERIEEVLTACVVAADAIRETLDSRR